jgi:hypothetical protein
MPRGAVLSCIAAATMLTLHDERGREAASLVVEPLDTTAGVPEAALDSASHDAHRGLPSPRFSTRIKLLSTRGCSPRSRQRWRTHSNKWLTRPESWRVLSIKHQDAPECVLTSIGKASPLRKYCVASLEFGVPGMDLLLCRRQTCVLTICHRPFSNKLKETTPSAISNYVQMTERGIFIRKYVSQVRFSIAYGAVLVRSVFDPQILPARATSQPF